VIAQAVRKENKFASKAWDLRLNSVLFVPAPLFLPITHKVGKSNTLSADQGSNGFFAVFHAHKASELPLFVVL
jgi:hypothetical protein